MAQRRWFGTSLPQTLQIANFLLYASAFWPILAVLSGGGSLYLLGTIAVYIAGGYGLANELKWGYVVALIAAFFPFVVWWLAEGELLSMVKEQPIALLFDIALVVLLVHPQSREYQKIWFK